jgi:hypothetical protein
MPLGFNETIGGWIPTEEKQYAGMKGGQNHTRDVLRQFHAKAADLSQHPRRTKTRSGSHEDYQYGANITAQKLATQTKFSDNYTYQNIFSVVY